MRSYDEMEFNPVVEELTRLLCVRTQNNNALFFRVLVSYYLTIVASSMRCQIRTHDQGNLPINMFALNLSPSGTGKGQSTRMMEDQVLAAFLQRFSDETFLIAAEENLPKIAVKRAGRKNSDPDTELQRVQKEFETLGPLNFFFDSASTPAIKQQRHKLLMADCGALNFQVDEIGLHLIAQREGFATFLEIFDQGKIKSKLIKSTSDNSRNEEIIGSTPANLLAFGAPGLVLDGASVEDELYRMLETGYARRFFFGYATTANKVLDLTKEAVYAQTTDPANDASLQRIAQQIEHLADVLNVNRVLEMQKETVLTLIEYRLECEKLAASFPEHENIKRNELSHRYSKALKLAGAYAFIDGSAELTEAHLYQAIKLAEASGAAFSKILTRERAHVKLAKYLAACRAPVTHADLVEDLPFYKGTQATRNDMIQLASGWGYQNNVIIKKSFQHGIEFLSGESLKVTDPNALIVAYSNDITEHFLNERITFDQLGQLAVVPDMHWAQFHFADGYRTDEKVLTQVGFNLVVLDFDDGAPSIAMAMELMKSYQFLLYTTKRHTPDAPRYRMVLPTNFELKLCGKEFKEFMDNVFEWLPFAVDLKTGQRSRKWLTNEHAQVFTNEGEPFDVLPFIPNTTKNEQRKVQLQTQAQMDNLERWVLNHIGDGNRNNLLLRFAMILVDAGLEQAEIQAKVFSLNGKLASPLGEAELLSTVMVTVGKAIYKRSQITQAQSQSITGMTGTTP